MWFVLLGIALVILVVGGIYFRYRVLWALGTMGVSHRKMRLASWAILWLLFGYPIIVFVYVLGSLMLGSESLAKVLGPVATWLLVYPFWIALLVMLQAVPFHLVLDTVAVLVGKRVGVDRVGRYRAVACLATVAVFAVYTPARIAVERDDLHVRDHQVGTPGESKPFRIAFFADLQRDQHTDRERADRVVALLNQQNPDIILVGGDWINTGPDFIAAAAQTGGALRSRLGTFSVRGDHEHFAYRNRERSVQVVAAALARHDVAMIDNEVHWVDHHGKRIALVFLSYNYIYRTPPDGIRQLVEQARNADASILVTHQLDSALVPLVADRIDLVLVAHTHGGQVNPVVGFSHVSLAGVETEYVDGRYRIGTTTVIVTAGIGYSIAPFRYASPASIEVIELGLGP